MDPTQCLKELLELIAEYHAVKASLYKDSPHSANFTDFTDYIQELSDIRENILEHLENLTYWLNRGGFIPTLPSLPEGVKAP